MRLDRAMNFYGERVAVAILGVACRYPYPALADAVLLDVGLLDALEANADVAGQHLGIVVRDFRVGRETVGKLVGQLAVLGFIVLVHSSASISLASPSGFAVGAWRATTLPERSTRNLVKFHLMDGPSRPAFCLFR